MAKSLVARLKLVQDRSGFVLYLTSFLINVSLQETFSTSFLTTRYTEYPFPDKTLVALTATATEQTRQYISSSLGMIAPVTITVNPNRKNIFYAASRRKNAGDDKIEELLLPYILKLMETREKMPLIVFYSNLDICGECYCIFDRLFGDNQYTHLGSEHLAKNRLFAQFHANYPEKEKNYILDDLIKGPGNIQVLFVTVAFGIGIDCPNIHEVVHIGEPNTMEEFFQESGRAGRDGEPALSRVLFNSYDIGNGNKNINHVMRKFASTTKCRRKVILEYFGFSVSDSDSEHCLQLCCDNCASSCFCKECQKKNQIYPLLWIS